jgi:Tol biopolymer transport system component
MPRDQTRLESWKEIAAYLNREVRTARRWEKERGLPVHRIPGKRSGVYALAPEIDGWLKTKAPDGFNGSGLIQGAPPEARSGTRVLTPWAAPAVAILLAIAVLSAVSATRSAAPRLIRPLRISNDGWLKGGPLAGGQSLFFVTLGGQPRTLKRIAESGGEASVIPFPSNTFNLLDSSRDGSQLLVGLVESDSRHWPLWVVPTTGGSPRRLADLRAVTAAWSPDGSTLAFAAEKVVYLSHADGTNPRVLALLPAAMPGEMRWAPDGRHLRLALLEGQGTGQFHRLWDVNLSKATAARALPGWSRTPSDHESGGEWTPDGRFFIFAAVHQGTSAIWAVREKSSLLDWRDAAPIQLATPPERVDSVMLSRDGKRVFANVPLPRRGELLRLEAGIGRFLPFTQMSGVSGGQLAYSPDGKRVVYAMYPDMSLWTVNADGSGPRPLPTDSLHGALPQWSPDGQRIAFMGWDKYNQPTKIRVVSAAGGQPQEPVQWPGWQGSPNWAAGGTELVFGENGPDFPIAASCQLHMFDFKSGKTTDLPGTTGLWTPRVCPSGRYIAAQTRDNRKLVLYDSRTAAVTELFASPEGKLGDNPVWSADGRFVYIDTAYSHDPFVYRIRIGDRRIERVASLSGYRRVEGGIGVWLGLTPDGSLLIVSEVQGSEIYAWDFVAP